METKRELATFCLKQIDYYRKQYDKAPWDDEFIKGIYNGRLYAYSDILQQLTGLRNTEEIKKYFDSLFPTSCRICLKDGGII
jgi:hypothetical protein